VFAARHAPPDAAAEVADARSSVLGPWRWALLLPAVLAPACFALQASLAGSSSAARADAIETSLSFAAAGAGCFAAASAFARGDYLRRAWALMGVCGALLMLKPLFFGSDAPYALRALSSSTALARGAITVVANLCVVAGMVLVGRAWRVAGLDLGVSRGARFGVTLLSAAFALAVAGGSAWQSARALLDGRLAALTPLASAAGDVASLMALAPVAMTALALRGGALAWPWGALALSTLGWLLFDGIAVSTELLGARIPMGHAFEEALRVFACASTLAAGLLQRAAIRGAGLAAPGG
jgi:hypothetical protein